MTTAYRRQGNDEFTKIYNKGLEQEERVLAFLASKGFTVKPATKEEQFQDIDLWLDGVPTSIKAENDGLRYGDIYFELVTERGRADVSEPLDQDTKDRIKKWAEKAVRTHKFTDLSTFYMSWFFTGKAEQYLILQGDRLRLYRKSEILDYMDLKGPDKVLGLSLYRLSTQGGKNTICAFIKSDAIRYSELTLPSEDPGK